ncbi:unnamed protein product [Nyctereutes procyonoides]|uniref:Small ribosomal subunit protein uS17 n=1 Tax=Nyctereutes procyonoides TaxID=34880 RepID=A0A811YY32_NYCPR|nr:unnamed protein product [Nyctereutes procyonoides]
MADVNAIDKKCPFPNYVSIQGQILSGVVIKVKIHRTIVICQDYLHYIQKYNCFKKCHKNMSLHLSPCFRDVNIGNVVTMGKCQPLREIVSFNMLKVTKTTGTKKQLQSSET